MTVAVGIIIGLVVALCVMLMMANQQNTPDTSTERKTPTTEEGRRISVVRGTTWVTSTQITIYYNPYDD